MNIDRIHHFNVRCAESDLAAIEKFYMEVAGLKKGYRPNLRNRGVWLYLGDQPIVHVTARCAEGFLQAEHHGSVDHIALQAHGAADLRARLDQLGIPYEQQNVADAGYQIFVTDPVGTAVEFNFPNSEAPQALAAGTLAPRGTATTA